jgi:hypothetical protein
MAAAAFSARKEKLDVCFICVKPLDPNDQDVTLRKTQLFCHQILHERCVEKWLAENSTCPFCEGDINDSRLHKMPNACSICLQPMEPNTKDRSLRTVQLLCDQILHERCFKQWVAATPTCPLCKFDVSDSKLRETIGYEFSHFIFER